MRLVAVQLIILNPTRSPDLVLLVATGDVGDTFGGLLQGLVDGNLLLEEVWPQHLLVDSVGTVLGHRRKAPGEEDHLGQPIEREVPENNRNQTT